VTLIGRAVIVAVALGAWACLSGCSVRTMRSTDYPGGIRVVEYSDGTTRAEMGGASYPMTRLAVAPPSRAWDRGDSQAVAVLGAAAWAGYFAIKGGFR